MRIDSGVTALEADSNQELPQIIEKQAAGTRK